jgi:hypothetical protein
MKNGQMDNRDSIPGMDMHQRGVFSSTWRTDKERDRGERRPEWMELKNRRYGRSGRERCQKDRAGVIESSTQWGDIGRMNERFFEGN